MIYKWDRVHSELDDNGWALLKSLVNSAQRRELIACYDDSSRFYKTVIMERHGFGRGEYKYLDDPLPDPIHVLRETLYPELAKIANQWHREIGSATHYPRRFASYEALCRESGQPRPTPLILRYEAGGFNCLHQDVYGEEIFPLQLTIMLSRPGIDFSGGEFALTEQRPRRQSRVEVVPLAAGDAVVFPVQWRPVRGTRGYYRAKMRHGVTTIRSGVRYAAGIIFHGAK